MVIGLSIPDIARPFAAIVAVMVLGGTALSQGVILWNESVNGELSRNPGAPTSLSPLQVGTNSVIGATEIVPDSGNWIAYCDDFLITVPTNLTVSSLYVTVDRSNVWAWIGDSSYSSRLGWAANPTNGDLLAEWGISQLTSRSYGMYMLNNDAQPGGSVANYRLDFVAQPAPEPTPIALWLAGALFLTLWCRRQLGIRRNGAPP